MKRQNLWEKTEKAAAGICLTALGIIILAGYPLTNAQAKTIYWELEESTDAEKDEPDIRQDQKKAAEISGVAWDTQEGTVKEWAGSLDALEYADYVAEEFQYLEEFDVTFDKKTDIFYYDDRKIRWLIDELADTNTQKCCYYQEGAIDVYTVRDKNGNLEGVRVADEEEFRKRTDKMNSAVFIEEESGTVKSEDDSCYEVFYSNYETAVNTAQGYGFAENDLFRALGLTPGEKNCWMYGDKKVCAIYVRDISFTTWGEADNGVYLYVTKEQKDDSINWTIQEVTKEEFEDIYRREGRKE